MATSRSTLSDRRGRRVPARTTKWLLRILGGACTLVGVFTLLSEGSAVRTYGSLILCGLLLLAKSTFTRQRAAKGSSPPTRPAGPETMSAADLSSTTPSGWDAIPVTVTMAAQPDAYFRQSRDSRSRESRL
jgi:hypothetical protein